MARLTYKSAMGDYGSVMEYTSKNDEIQALRNRLGKYEDLFDEFHRIYYSIAGNYTIDEENAVPLQEWMNERLFARLARGLAQNKE